VIFTAGWNDNCYFTQSLWDKFAKRFTTGKLKFIEVDILKFDSLARLYRIATTGFEKGLPALILFEDGKQIIRFPLAKKDEPATSSSWFGIGTTTAGTPQYLEKELIKYFDLDKRYLATSSGESGCVTEKKKAAT
jgi:hypothetical protein